MPGAGGGETWSLTWLPVLAGGRRRVRACLSCDGVRPCYGFHWRSGCSLAGRELQAARAVVEVVSATVCHHWTMSLLRYDALTLSPDRRRRSTVLLLYTAARLNVVHVIANVTAHYFVDLLLRSHFWHSNIST